MSLHVPSVLIISSRHFVKSISCPGSFDQSFRSYKFLKHIFQIQKTQDYNTDEISIQKLVDSWKILCYIATVRSDFSFLLRELWRMKQGNVSPVPISWCETEPEVFKLVKKV